MKFTVRDLVYIAIFGAIWGALEMTFGSYLHVIIPPPATPLIGVGTIMTAVGIIVALIGRLFVPKVGSVLMIGVVTAVLKALSVGGVKLSPMIGITIECSLAEIGLLLANSLPYPASNLSTLIRGEGVRNLPRRPNRWGFVFAGSLALLWTFFHKFLASYVFLGRAIYEVYLEMLGKGTRVLGIDARYGLVIIAVFPLIRIVMGGTAGWLAWEMGRMVQARLGRMAGGRHG